MEAIYERAYPYSELYVKNFQCVQDRINAEKLASMLFDLLPHGSGINYTWKIYQHKSNRNRYTCHNSYDSMNEWGLYCHVYDFSVTVDYVGGKFSVVRFSFKSQHEHSCCGYGLKEYLQDTLYYSIEN